MGGGGGKDSFAYSSTYGMDRTVVHGPAQAPCCRMMPSDTKRVMALVGWQLSGS